MSRGDRQGHEDRDVGDDEPSPPEGFSLPGQSADETAERAQDEDADWEAPPKLRDPLLRDRLRERLGVTPTQWYIIESFLLVLPYPLFVLVYLSTDVNETVFLLGTLAYSLVAMYVGFLS